jgi:hypothetical protein
MTPIKKAERLAIGETLSRQEIRGDEEKILETLKVIRKNCQIVIKQIEELQK